MAIETRTEASSSAGSYGGQKEKIMGDAAEYGKSAAREQKTMAARTIGRMARALHQTGSNLEQEQDSSSARYFHQAADGLDRFSANLEKQDLENLLSQSQEYARRHPAVVFGGAMAAGFVLSRFMKSSTTRRRQEATGGKQGTSREEMTPSGGGAAMGQPEQKREYLGIDESEMRQSRPYGTMSPPESSPES